MIGLGISCRGGFMKKRRTIHPAAALDAAAPVFRRDYRDTVFRMLFHEKKSLLSLYNALNQTEYADPEALQIVTLKNAVYMNMKNDLAFILDLELNLYEHQSTWNPNMPLRNLFYISREYQDLVRNNSIYSSHRIAIPRPRFLVFYNGREMSEEHCVLKLSEAYEKRCSESDLFREPELDLELRVHVLNINAGKNQALMDACQELREYALYTELVRRYAGETALNEAVERAVSECIKEGILRDFLMKNRAEAIAVSIFEYDEERELRLIREEEFEEGRKTGLREGRESGRRSLLLEQVQKKWKKGKSVVQIAEELEEELSVIETAVRELKEEKP